MHVVKHVLLVAHHERPDAAALAAQAAAWLEARGHVAWMTPDDAAACALGGLAGDPLMRRADLVISLGGDGTVLRAVQLAAADDAPVIGVNVGMLGYLTEVEPGALLDCLEQWFDPTAAASHSIDERMMLEVTVRTADGAADSSWTALNDAVVEKLESGHTVRLQVHIDGAPFTSYAADGLILATPTGSTAYSLSARGPVLSPRLKAVLLTPVSPHMLFDRSLVLDPSEVVDVEVLGHRPVALSVDGRVVATLVEGDVVAVRPAAHVARFVQFAERRFHRILKAKFGLADR